MGPTGEKLRARVGGWVGGSMGGRVAKGRGVNGVDGLFASAAKPRSPEIEGGALGSIPREGEGAAGGGIGTRASAVDTGRVSGLGPSSASGASGPRLGGGGGASWSCDKADGGDTGVTG
jgi:hypothetical protein